MPDDTSSLHAGTNCAHERTEKLPNAAVPDRVGKYKVLQRLGMGATSEVLLALDEFVGQKVAIKRLRPAEERSHGNQFYERHFFAAEAALINRLRHPNVVEILDAVDDGDRPYLVMEYVPGTTLRTFCEPGHLLPLEQVVEIGFKCANALGHVFRQGMIHRDVKPANILAVMDHHVVVDIKLSDFGSALDLAADRTQVHRVGSLAYMSPEQIDGAALDARSDMYSLAAVLYHLIAGRPPFMADSPAALMQQIAQVNATPLGELREAVSRELDETIRAALNKQRGDRPATWEQFAAGLSSLIAGHHVPRGPLQQVLDSERYTLLRALEFFQAFEDAQIWEVVHRARWQRLPIGQRLYQKGRTSQRFYIIAQGEVVVQRDGQTVATLGAGTSVGEMRYLAPNPEMAVHQADVIVTEPAITVSFTTQALASLSAPTKHRFDQAFIQVLVRRLHAAHEALDHPRKIM